MSFVLEKVNPKLTAPFIIVCEGMGGVFLIDALLQHHGITNCQVGCPSTESVGGMGKDKIPDYLDLIQTASIFQKHNIRGVMIVGDADKCHAEAVEELSTAIATASYPQPSGPFLLEELVYGGNPLRMGIYVIPGVDRDGTLEHLLLEAILDQSPQKGDCIDNFMRCVGSPTDHTSNQLAKMKMSALVGASCKKNPWASSALVWKDPLNPIPPDSVTFSHLADFIVRFTAPA